MPFARSQQIAALGKENDRVAKFASYTELVSTSLKNQSEGPWTYPHAMCLKV